MWAYPSTKSRAETADWIRWARDSYAANGWGLWAVVRRSDGRCRGDCGPMLQPVEGETVPELGYHIVRAEWGHGYATEAALACRDWFFANTTRDRLVSIVWPPNTASRRVSEKVHAADARVRVGEVGHSRVPATRRCARICARRPELHRLAQGRV